VNLYNHVNARVFRHTGFSPLLFNKLVTQELAQVN